MPAAKSVDELSQQEIETPVTRLRAAWNYATSPVEEGKEVPEPPPELKEWSQNTSLGVFSGLLFGGAGQWLRDRQAGAFQPPQGAALNKAALARLQAEESTRRLVRIANETLRGGLRFGALAGLFYAVQQISSIARAEKGLPDTVAGGTAAGAVFGATDIAYAAALGSKGARVRSVAVGTALGAAAGLIGGFMQESLVSFLPLEEQQKYHQPPSIPRTAEQQHQLEDNAEKRRHPNAHSDATSAVIDQLERSLHRQQTEHSESQSS